MVHACRVPDRRPGAELNPLKRESDTASYNKGEERVKKEKWEEDESVC